MWRRDVAIILITMAFGVMLFSALFFHIVAKRESWQPRDEDSLNPENLPRLTDVAAFPAEHQSAAQAVADALTKSGERPEDFLAQVELQADGTLVFHLWHNSAFAPENRLVAGNPGGKCRSAYFDPKTGRVSFLFWQ